MKNASDMVKITLCCTMRGAVHVLTLRILAVFVTVSTAASSICPAGCHCNFTTQDPRVICPPPQQRIPSGLTADVRALVLPGSATSQNAIPRLSRSSLSSLSGLRELWLPFSGVVTLEHGVFSSTSALKIVDLQHNAIGVLAADTFAGLGDLEYLDLTGNSGCVLEKGIFSGLSRLRTLLLGETGLSVLPRDLFSDLRALSFLDLHGNGIREVEPDVLVPMRSLQHLDLRYNDLEMLSPSLQPFASSLRRLQLSNNPWRCNCEARWLKSLSFLRPDPLTSIVHASDLVVCSSPARLGFRSLIMVPNGEMTCTPPSVTSCSGPLVASLGDQVTLTCTLGVSDPDPDVTWTSPEGLHVHNGTQYLTSRTGNTWSLVILTTGEKDDGNWSVTASNRHGTDNESVEVHVITPSTSTTQTTIATTAPSAMSSSEAGTPDLGVRVKSSREDVGFYVAIGAFSAVGMVTVVIFVAAACRARAKARQQVAPKTSRIAVREAGDVTLVFHVFTPRRRMWLIKLVSSKQFEASFFKVDNFGGAGDVCPIYDISHLEDSLDLI